MNFELSLQFDTWEIQVWCPEDFELTLISICPQGPIRINRGPPILVRILWCAMTTGAKIRDEIHHPCATIERIIQIRSVQLYCSFCVCLCVCVCFLPNSDLRAFGKENSRKVIPPLHLKEKAIEESTLNKNPHRVRRPHALSSRSRNTFMFPKCLGQGRVQQCTFFSIFDTHSCFHNDENFFESNPGEISENFKSCIWIASKQYFNCRKIKTSYILL